MMGWFSPDLCGICDSPLKRVRMDVRVNGRDLVACATCARALAEMKSKKAVESLAKGTLVEDAPDHKRKSNKLSGCFVFFVFATMAIVFGWMIWKAS